MISTIIYPIYANWVWGGGWLSTLGTSFGLGHGHVDFAGSSVVHMTGGVSAAVLAWAGALVVAELQARQQGRTILAPWVEPAGFRFTPSATAP